MAASGLIRIKSGNSWPFNDRDESVFYFRFQYLKNKINGLSSAFRIFVKKVVHCSVIFYKYHVEDAWNISTGRTKIFITRTSFRSERLNSDIED